MRENFYSSSKENDEVDLGKILRFLLMQSKLIIAITISGLIISSLIYSSATKQYSIRSLLQYEPFKQNILDPSVAIRMNTGMPSSSINNVIALYKSRSNMLKVIEDLKLNIDVKDLTDNENIDIEIRSKTKNQFKKHNMNFSFSKDGYALIDDGNKEKVFVNYGKYIFHNDMEIVVHSSNLSENRVVGVSYQHPESIYKRLKSQIVIDSLVSKNDFFKNEGLISVSYITDNPDFGIKIIDYANQIFLNQRISAETEKSRKAIDFIDKNIKSLDQVVQSKKIKLKEFREKNQSIDVSLEIQGIIKKVEFLEQSLSSIDIAISKAQEIYTQNNPAFLNLLNEKKIIEKQKQEILSEIESMPKEQQEYIDLYNDVEVSQALFEELKSRRLGLSITEASTIGDIRVVDAAYFDSQVSPKIISIILSGLISLIIGCVVAIFRGFIFLPISNPAELFDNNINLPIIGVVPKIEDFENLEDDIGLSTSIESLIINIDTMSEDNKKGNIITITSPGPSNGKSTNSTMLAKGYSKLGKKVLLIDGDLKRGKLARNFNRNSIDQAEFNSINELNINDYLIEENFYLIPRVKKLNNTFEFLYNANYKEKIKFFKEYFDVVILDTAPILSIADSSVLVEQSDINILIIRHETNRINEVKQVIDQFGQINKEIDGVVYNAYAKPRSYYGYYGLYGSYSYRYYAEKYLDNVYGYKD